MTYLCLFFFIINKKYYTNNIIVNHKEQQYNNRKQNILNNDKHNQSIYKNNCYNNYRNSSIKKGFEDCAIIPLRLMPKND